MYIVVINCGSSSIKFQLFETETLRTRADCVVERLGEPDSHMLCRSFSADSDYNEQQYDLPTSNHSEGIEAILKWLREHQVFSSPQSLDVIGHRVVHGGERYVNPILVSDELIAELRKSGLLAPLHNQANIEGIEVVRRFYPDVPQVAVFDTAFHQTLPQAAYRYAVPEVFYTEHGLRRYGFHGISHSAVSRAASHFLHRPLTSLRLITLHLGNGASAAAIKHGQCVDTSMGLTPLEGLVMGTRCGDMDPAAVTFIARITNKSLAEVEKILNRDSGLKGLCSVSDMREVHRLADSGDENARLAIDLFCYRIVKYVGAYYTVLGGLDALVFTAGIGENDPDVRRLIIGQLHVLGLYIDESKNQKDINDAIDISDQSSKAAVLVIPAAEEEEIARQALAVI